MARLVRWALLLGILSSGGATAAQPGNWPQFRGPLGDGHADAVDLPVTWSESENIKWKTPIHDRGHSSPVIWDDQIWLTTAATDGERSRFRSEAEAAARLQHPNIVQVYEVGEADGRPFLAWTDPEPLAGAGHEYLAFDDWEAPLTFDDLRIRPAP